jgi:putative restriction endonuclease
VIGIEAAHVRWHAYDGPSVVENGLALCVLHHKLFDLGVLGIAPERTVLVSGRVSGDADVEGHAGRALRRPQAGVLGVSADYADWHRREVFKAPAREVRAGG